MSDSADKPRDKQSSDAPAADDPWAKWRKPDAGAARQNGKLSPSQSRGRLRSRLSIR